MFGHNKTTQESRMSISERDEYNTELLERILEVTEESNDILLDLKKSERRSRMFTYAYWALVLGALGGVFYYLKPIVDFLFQNFGFLKDMIYGVAGHTQNLPETSNLQNILNQLKQ